MCLAIPGMIECITDPGELTRSGKVNFGGIRRDVNLSCVPDADVGDYVIVHVGMAISKVDPDEAQQVFKYLEEMNELAALSSPEEHPSA